MKRLSQLTLVFALVFAVFIVGPAFLSDQFAPYELLKNGDILDLLTPLAVIPLYWLLFQVRKDAQPGTKETIWFLVFAGLWIEGQGMHLGGNAIGHLLKESTGTDAYTLTYFVDEVLSHYLWHIGIITLIALLIYRQWQMPFEGSNPSTGLVIAAGIIHGFNYFITYVEGATVPLGLPFALAVTLFGVLRGRDKFKQQPVLHFFFVTCLVALIFFTGWGLYWGGFPEFSQVGIID